MSNNYHGLVFAAPSAQETPQEAGHAYWALAGMHASIAAPHFIFPEEASTCAHQHSIEPALVSIAIALQCCQCVAA